MTENAEAAACLATQAAEDRIALVHQRRRAVTQGVASARAEGIQVSDFALGLLEDWAQGLIDMQQVIDALIAYYTPASSSESSESPHHS